MAKSKKSKVYNLIFLVVIMLFIIPQTRQPIQVFLSKIMVMIVKPSLVEDSERILISDYNWQLKDISGNDFDFNSVKGKVIVINFWATWCPPCIAEMPSLQDLFKNYQDNEDVVFLFISNENKEKLYEFMTHNNYTFPIYQPLAPYPSEFNVSSIPRTFIINREGEIVIDKTGAANWNSENVREVIGTMLIKHK